MLKEGEVHGRKFMMEEGRFMLEGEVHIEAGEVHFEGGRGTRWRRGVSCWRMVEFLLAVGGFKRVSRFWIKWFLKFKLM